MQGGMLRDALKGRTLVKKTRQRSGWHKPAEWTV